VSKKFNPKKVVTLLWQKNWKRKKLPRFRVKKNGDGIFDTRFIWYEWDQRTPMDQVIPKSIWE